MQNLSTIVVVLDKELKGDNRVIRQVNILQEKGHKVIIICYDFLDTDEYHFEKFTLEKIRIKKSKANRLLPLENRFRTLTRFWSKRILRAIWKYKPKYIIAHDLYMAKPARKAISNSRNQIKLILDLHENFPSAILTYGWTKSKLKWFLSLPKLWKSKEKEYLKYADKIMVLSASFAKDLTSAYPELNKEQFIEFPNLPDVKLLDQYGIKPEIFPKISHPIMFYFGFIGERRGIFDSLKAFKLVIERGFSVDYLLAGPVDKNDRTRFNNVIKDESIKKNIHYIPWIDIADLPTYLKYVDFCVAPFKVNPQHESGIANKIFQYMYGAKAIIASNCRPQAQLIRDADAGLIYNSIEEFSDHIEYLSANPENTKEMGENGRKCLNEYPDFTVNFLQLFSSN